MAKFSSRRRELCIVVRPSDSIIDEQRRRVVKPGKRAEFFNGLYETHDQEIIDFLRKHPYFNRKFSEITPKDETAIKLAQAEVSGVPIPPKPVVPVVDGMVKTTNVLGTEESTGVVDIPTRPTDTVSVSPELVKIIDERINKALEVIVGLLQKDEAKEKNIVAEKPIPTKSFSCPFCGESFDSGFKVGKHKKVCPKRT